MSPQIIPNNWEDKVEMFTDELGLSPRNVNLLEKRGILTVKDLLKYTRDQLLAIPNFGDKSVDEVYKKLEEIGFCRDNDQQTEQQE
ncbi:DNA-directed RNA polymerase subunit alpha [Patescibacteria group bacterium]|nr:DNA-directed RNA polymerase subunit alpha [Patescibacteria group bacterium]